MSSLTPEFGLLVMEIDDPMNNLANENMQKIEDAILGRKPKQTPVPPSTAIDGLSVYFISNVSQDEDGVITTERKMIPWASSVYPGIIQLGYTQNNKNYPVVLDGNNLAYVNVPWTNTTYSDATTSAHGLMTAADKTKLNGIEAGAQKNPGAATTSAAGLMSAADKTKLNGIAAGAGVNTWRGFSMVTHSYTYTVAAGGNIDIKANQFGIGKSGYTPVAIFLMNPGTFNCQIMNARCDVSGNNPAMNVKNLTNSQQTATAYLGVLYLQNG